MPANLPELFQQSAEKFGNRPAFVSKDESKSYKPVTFKEVYDLGINLAEALIDLGVSAKENVALLADNRLEWIVSDYGILMSGAADVPRGTDITDSEIVYILNHCEAKVVFLENDKMLEKFQKNRSQLEFAKTLIVMDKKSTATGVLKLYDLIEKGKELRAKGSKKAEERMKAILPDDLFTIIYTSGTTGMPKGVMLKHSNMIHQTTAILGSMIDIKADERMLSILPVWHVFERVFEYLAIAAGCATYYTNVRDLRDDMKKAKPTFMASAPRLWESIYNGIYTRINDPKQTPAIRRGLFNLAYFFSKHFNASMRFLKGNQVDYVGRNPIVSLFKGVYYLTVAIVLAVPYFLLDLVVLSKIREATGGELKASVSGGGALQRHVDAFFNDIGINVLEGYGMTETSPVISVRTFKKLVQGSVGVITPETSVQIRDDLGKVLTHVDANNQLVSGKYGQRGVIHIRGPQVMKGYYKNPETTAKVLKDGWMDTGDIGMFNFKKTLTITGRAKDTVVLLGGENVEPVPIEDKLTESPFISQCMVIGQDQKNLGAIVIPDFDQLMAWAKENGISETDKQKLIENPKVLDFYKKEIKALNNTKTGFKSFEQVTPFILITKPFEVGDELTNLFKMKRHLITEKYKDKIAALYAGD
ncbi:long-chain fatty acid--CoA ligase [Leptospira biflexa]|jgi:long-chain acyl-CoA synthetase|uniref:Putative long-chain-fatty-acid CoA ligase n=1 Tax=Leptospira biflexa serovar Patoc (strain Patoc 1 / ATCC 23582 / Paris) TaxID=456481 RepID=B0SR46_LEPBP|nr:AMP-binding protein [Leptospira biflexa]ABZ94098.1 Long-chain-fatty-acid--CoA ligase [Leptospira biflexa serovar Patoc strain 'Patoc 1 (Ames)']ABZ97747.1 Putative long-chain-fatty-acid CoA ligase [Leptospira biflexa serovar Patoc strain 'Patoc 1 (Paris)']TGM48470.1 long-chain fatty acid--CoA ligase [Leptospira biflexa]TGM49064.1 long-chain fatty acid--CoA ligase [Leptospira biflexa]TGM54334.1 long-chain fatty acid--CoA ligase [Leptospira biflexa]